MRMFITNSMGTVHLMRADGTTCPQGTRVQRRLAVSDLQCKVYKLAPCSHCWPQPNEFDRNINRRIK